MREVKESEIDNDFEREYAWGDDLRHQFNRKRKKGSVFGYFLRFEAVLELVKKFAPGPRIGDFAAAHCNFALALAEEGFDVTAVDIKPEFLNYAKKKYTHGKFQTVVANVIESRAAEKFDLIILGEVIEHVAFPDQLLRAARENLNAGGVVLVTTPNGNEFDQPLPTFKQVKNVEALIPRQFHWGDHLFLYTDQELRELMEQAGFEILLCRKQNSSYVSQIKAVRYILPLKFLKWLDERYRTRQKNGKDSTNCLIMVGRLKNH